MDDLSKISTDDLLREIIQRQPWNAQQGVLWEGIVVENCQPMDSTERFDVRVTRLRD